MPIKRRLLEEPEIGLLRLESSVWIEVLQTLRGVLHDDSECETRDDFPELADAASAALEACAAMASGPHEALVAQARERLEQALRASSKYDDLIESLFYIRFATRSVEGLVAEAEEMDARQVSQNEKEQLKADLGNVVGELEKSLAELRERLTPPDSSETDGPYPQSRQDA